MRESSKTYIKNYTKALYHVSSRVLFWSTVVGVLYINVLYANAHRHNNNYDI